MIRRNRAFLNYINFVSDMLLVVVAYVLASWIRIDLMDGNSNNMAALSPDSVFLAVIYAIGVFVILSILGFYNSRNRRLSWKIRTIFTAVTLAVLLASTILYIFRMVDFSRGVLYLFYGLTVLFLCAKYIVMRVWFDNVRSRGYNLQHVLVVGTGKLAKQFAKDAEKELSRGYEITGFIGKEEEGIKYLGEYSTLEEHLLSPEIQEVVIALEPEEYEQIPLMIAACEKQGVKYYIIPFYNDITPAHPIIEVVGNSKLIDMRANRLEGMGWSGLKRVADILISALALLVLSPLMCLIAIGVRLSSPGPALFRQIRVGYQRTEFEILKFRSMKLNSEENIAWTRDRDNRRTSFGSFLRKTSLDELPQLINVLKGDMSLVGPRPELPVFVEQFKETIPFYMVKHQVKPGITGWAQVNGYRGDTSIEKRIELDLWYIDNWSIWLDVRILFRTVFGGMINQEKRSSKK